MTMIDYSTDSDQTAPKQTVREKPAEPIDKLKPKSPEHDKVLSYLLTRLDYSERMMSQFYSRWNSNEMRVQAYINLPDYERQLKEMNAKGLPPALVQITVPYSFATIWTIVTYLIHTFCGQKPMFQVSAYAPENIEPARYMETMLQFNADHTRMILRLIQWFLDGEIYGVGVTRNLFKEEYANRTAWTQNDLGGLLVPGMGARKTRQRKRQMVYQGNDVSNIDPFMFFPDPRVPMAEVNKRGEFVFWRNYESKMTLLTEQRNGSLQWVEHIGAMPSAITGDSARSQRGLLAKGTSSAGDPSVFRDARAAPFYQIDQGTINIIPKDLGLGDEEYPVKWLFSIGNKTQIIQAEPLEYDHDRHPVSVIEPSSFGYAFGQPGTLDFLGPIQETLSWFINSHIQNVRSAINNMWVVDPSMVEMQDLKNPGPGKIIRLKRTAYGQDIKQFLQQLNVQDVTQNHMGSMEVFLRMGDVLSAVNDNLKGIQDSGGRKTATEVRTSGEAGASRLAARARYISAQGMVDITEQMALNIQQFQDMEYYLAVVGKEGAQNPITIKPEMLAGNFYFPVSDGTLPIDRTALLGVWKEIWLAVSQNPLLMQKYDDGKMFEYIAELGGARNIAQFQKAGAEVSVMPDAQVQQGAQSGNLAPIGPPGPRGNPAGGGTSSANGGGAPRPAGPPQLPTGGPSFTRPPG